VPPGIGLPKVPDINLSLSDKRKVRVFKMNYETARLGGRTQEGIGSQHWGATCVDF